MEERKVGGVLVELDALLDTRIAVLAYHYPAIAEKMMHGFEYWARDRDDFSWAGGPNQAEFRALYDARTADMIAGAMRTTMPFIVKDLMMKLELEEEATPRLKDVSLDINIWPYVFDEQEQDDLKKIMMVYGGINTIPTIVSISPDELTFQMIRERYSGLVMYDFQPWMLKHINSIRSMYIYDVTFYVPELLFGQLPSKTELREMELREDLDIFSSHSQLWREFMFIDYFPAAVFSLHRSIIAEAIFAERAQRSKPGEGPA